MKNFYTRSLLVIGLFCAWEAGAQNAAFLEANNIRSGFTSVGGLYQTDTSWSEFKIRHTGESSPFFAGSLWFSGFRGDTLLTAAHTYRQQGIDFWPGPISDDYSDSSYQSKYHRVWKVTEAQIAQHKNDFQQPGYQTPEVIANWPAHGDTAAGEPFHLASFNDLNGNGHYEPWLGDYPNIRGDEAVYVIYNDDLPHTETQGEQLGIEVHMLAYAFDRPQDEALDNTVFLNFKVINRSNVAIDSFRAAHWFDLQLSPAPNDALLGSDSTTGLSYWYSKDSISIGPLGFGAYPPATGVAFLQDRAEGLGYFFNDLTAMGNPTNASHYYNYMRQRWRNGAPLVLHNPSGLMDSANGDGFPANPTAFSRTHWAFNDQANWYQAPQADMDMRGVLSSAHQTLAPGEHICLDIATMYARDSSDAAPYTSVNKLKSNYASVQQFYDAQDYPCIGKRVGLVEHSTAPTRLYPNPARDYLMISGEAPLKRVELLNLAGQKVQTVELNGEKEYQMHFQAQMNHGLYILQITTQSGRVKSEKVLVK